MFFLIKGNIGISNFLGGVLKPIVDHAQYLLGACAEGAHPTLTAVPSETPRPRVQDDGRSRAAIRHAQPPETCFAFSRFLNFSGFLF